MVNIKQNSSGKIKRYSDLITVLFHSTETSLSYIFYYLLVVNISKHIFLVEMGKKWKGKHIGLYMKEQPPSSNQLQPFKFEFALERVSLKIQ